MPGKIKFHPVKVLTSGQSEGRLAFAGDTLAAVLVLLDGTHNDLNGRWYAEAAFDGLERMQEKTFEDLDAAARWIEAQLSEK